MTLPDLGVGLVYWPGLEPLLEEGTELVQVVEIEPEAFWLEAPGAEQPLRPDPQAHALLRSFPQRKLLHGVGFPVGGTRRPDERHLPPFAELALELGCPWASEHLSVNEAAGAGESFKTGFLLPPRQSPAGAAAAAATVRSVASRLPVPFAVETGVNYLRRREDDLPDGAFVAEVAEAADCGILLDLHNIWLNERNGRQAALDYVAELPLERVWEIHLAGGFELDGYWLDAHSDTVPEPLHALAERILPLLPNLHALVFELLPEHFARIGLDGIRAQLERLHELWALRGGDAASAPLRRDVRAVPSNGPKPEEWENALGALVARQPVSSPLAGELAADPGVAILRRLADEARAGMVVESLRLTSRLLMLTTGPARFRELLASYWRATPPALFASTEADGFASFLAAQPLDVPLLPDVLAFEHAVLRARVHGERSVVPFGYDPSAVFEALGEGRLPDAPAPEPLELVVEPV